MQSAYYTINKNKSARTKIQLVLADLFLLNVIREICESALSPRRNELTGIYIIAIMIISKR